VNYVGEKVIDMKNIKTFPPEIAEKVALACTEINRTRALEDMRDYHRAQADRIFISGKTRSTHIMYWLVCRDVLEEIAEKKHD